MAHNWCVLKERRIPLGAHTCFAVAECWGWRLGLVGGGGSAGSVLHSQGTLGPVGLSRYRARGIRVSTFQCSLRPDPAAARGERVGVDGAGQALDQTRSDEVVLVGASFALPGGGWGRLI